MPDQLSGKRVLLTGGTGFIGANLVRNLLQNGAEVTVITRSGSNRDRLHSILDSIHIVEIEFADPGSLQLAFSKNKPDYVIHLAFPTGYPSNEPEQKEMLICAVRDTYNLLSAAYSVGCERYIHFGSSTEYGRLTHSFREIDPLNPVTWRGMAKAAACMLSRQFAIEHNFPLSILRLFSIYGPMENPKRFIPSVCLSALQQKAIYLTPEEVVHDFLHVDDVAFACRLTLIHGTAPGEIFNIGSGQQITNEGVVEQLQQISDLPIKQHIGGYEKKSQDLSFWQADIHKAKEILNWQPRYSLHQGLEKTFYWWQEYKNHPEGPF